MLNHLVRQPAFAMNPEGSLNRLPVNGMLLHARDPLLNQPDLTGSQLVSRAALVRLIELYRPSNTDLRNFLGSFTGTGYAEADILTIYAHRFAAVIKTARAGVGWHSGSEYHQALAAHWQSTETVVISGGLTSAQFGIELAGQVEQLCGDIAIINSPWGGLTALYGLAQNVAVSRDMLVMDFGGTGIKRAIAHRYGNRLTVLPELNVDAFKTDGLVRKEGFIAALEQTRHLLDEPMDTAISLACYLEKGHPFDYYSGIYHRLGEDSTHLATDLDESWLPSIDMGQLLMMEHDSTAAALAFRFNHPAMMITLGTGLGSAPCPVKAES